MDKGKAELYALLDPRDNQVRYIGYTTTPKDRLKYHINSCNNLKKIREVNCYRCKWIRSLNKLNLKPIHKKLFIVNFDKVKELEIELIKYYRQFFKLTNGTKGGDGVNGLRWSEESKVKMRNTKKGILNLKNRKPVIITNIETKKSIEFDSAITASKYLNCHQEAIRQLCRKDKKRKTIYNHTCEYKREVGKKIL